MRFSLSLPLLRDRTRRDPYQDTFELARIAEEVGFDTATIGHHHFMPGNLADPLTFLAAVGARTSTLRVGTGIFQLPFHHPVRVAEQVATIDEMTGGRVSLGVGLGWWDKEYETYGLPFSKRGALLEEALEILRLVWTEEDVSRPSSRWAIDGITVHPRPVQRPHPPLWVAGVAPRAIDRAARLGDAWLAGPNLSLPMVESCLDIYRERRDPTGRDADWILRRYAWVALDDDHVREHIVPAYVRGLVDHLRESSEVPAEREAIARIDAGDEQALEQFALERLLWGSPERVVEQVEHYVATTGADHVHAAFGAGLPGNAGDRSGLGEFEEMAAMIRLYGTEVIAAFAGR